MSSAASSTSTRVSTRYHQSKVRWLSISSKLWRAWRHAHSRSQARRAHAVSAARLATTVAANPEVESLYRMGSRGWSNPAMLIGAVRTAFVPRHGAGEFFGRQSRTRPDNGHAHGQSRTTGQRTLKI